MPIKEALKVSIEFSPDGQYLAILLKKVNILRIYKIPQLDIKQLIYEFEHENDQYDHLLLEFRKNPEFKKCKSLEFDDRKENCRYLAWYGIQALHIIDLF